VENIPLPSEAKQTKLVLKMVSAHYSWKNEKQDRWRHRKYFEVNVAVVGCIIKGTKVTAQFGKNLEPSKIIYIHVD
jgi:hypothetical protein